MSKTAKWIIGVAVAIIVLQFLSPFIWQLILPGTQAGYGMMGRGYGYGMHMPMMGYGSGFGFFGILWIVIANKKSQRPSSCLNRGFLLHLKWYTARILPNPGDL
jgi:hypothetical protein